MRGETAPDMVIGGRYKLVDRLGAGGFGQVWRARDLALAVDVAVKEVRLDDAVPHALRGELLDRAGREARNAARLRDHPHIVTVHDVVEVDGIPWIVMQLVDGRSLAEELDERGTLPVGRAADVARALLSGLEAVHRAGLVHRDVKPANTMLASSGAILLADFGIAVDRKDPRLTAPDMVIGSPGYMAPERWQGAPYDGRADLFSLGATLYEAMEGVLPFPASNPTAVLTEPPRPPVRAGRLTALVMALLRKDPAQRPTIAQALDMLDRAASTLRLPITQEQSPDRRKPSQVRTSGPVTISHTRQALTRRSTQDASCLIALAFVLLGAVAGLLRDAHVHHGHYDRLSGLLVVGLVAGAVVGGLVSSAVGYVRGFFLTSDSVTFAHESITVTQASAARSIRVRWDDVSLIALTGPAGGRKDLVVWFADEEAGRSMRLERLKGLDNERGLAHRLYSTAAGANRPQQLQADQLTDPLRAHAAELYYEMAIPPMSRLVGVGGGNILAVDGAGNLWRYSAPGYDRFEKTRVGFGWGKMKKLVAVGGSNGDILAISDSGDMYRYRGPDYHGPSRTRVGTGWETMRHVTSTGDGTGDLFAVDHAGRLFHYRGPHYHGSQRKQIGSNWGTMNAVVGVGDISGSGSADILAVDDAGRLFHYRGPHYHGSQRKQIGTGWNTMTNLVAIPGSGTTDLLATGATTGHLYRYTGPAYSGARRRRIGTSW
ncbi:protein kinase domain-containing protein [Streptomyces misionensis]